MVAYGPIGSPRLGRTLEVSPIPPRTCTYSCVYCRYGRPSDLRIKRESFYPPGEILDEILAVARRTAPDCVRFSGRGEPTLCRDLGGLIRGFKAESAIPVAVSTNASLLYRKDVRQDLAEADVVLTSLDAGAGSGAEEIFLRLNRPHLSLDLDRVLEGLARFRREHAGRIWLETMLVAGINDGPEALERIQRAVDLLVPDRVYLLRPAHPPVEPWVRPPLSSVLAEAVRRIRGARSFDRTEEGPAELLGFDDAREAVSALAAHAQLRWSRVTSVENELRAPGLVRRMIDTGDLIPVEFDGERFLLPPSIARRRRA